MFKLELNLTRKFIEDFTEDAALALNDIDVGKLKSLFTKLPKKTVSCILKNISPLEASKILQLLEFERSKELLLLLEIKDISMILRYCTKSYVNRFLNNVSIKIKTSCIYYLYYPKNTIGSWMSPWIIILPVSISCVEAYKKLHTSLSKFKSCSYIYVVDSNKVYIGVINIIDLVRFKYKEFSLDKLVTKLPALHARTPVDIAKKSQLWSKYDVIPVVNRSRQILGVINRSDLTRVSLVKHEEQNDIKYFSFIEFSITYGKTLNQIINFFFPSSNDNK